MIYFVKLLYSTFLLPPGIIILLLLLLAVYMVRNQSRGSKALFVIIAVFYVLTTPWAGGILLGSLENDYVPPSDPAGDVIVMLGAGATAGTPNVSSTGHLYGYAANRLITCAQLYRKLNLPIIVSGGELMESEGTEAEIARGILIGLGVAEDKIICENKSRNTTQNAEYTKVIMVDRGLKKPILVTSAFHMRRSVRQFEKVGIPVTPYPTDYQVPLKGKLHLLNLFPSADALNKVSLSWKEYIGILASGWY